MTVSFFIMFFGRTDLRIGESKAKFDAESDFEVRLAVDTQKTGQLPSTLRKSFFFGEFFGSEN